MLDFDYTERLNSLIQSMNWQIRLPPIWSNYFEETGESVPLPKDQRQNRRMKVRSLGLMVYEKPLPSVPREPCPVGVYSKDFSRKGCGFLSPVPVYPEETVLLILPTFWLRLVICRCRRVGASCYEVGGELLAQAPPSEKAFAGLEAPCEGIGN
jgi:hypothetical protein